MNLSFKVLLSR